MKFKHLFLFPILLFLFACSPQLASFQVPPDLKAPDYSNPDHWGALPFRQDAADVVPHGEKWISDSLKEVDVFYVHPTMYLKGDTWNASIENDKLNKRIDKKPVKLQASVFNRSARVFAPRYRQAHIHAFKEDTVEGKKALDFAYQDVVNAFEYYLENHNNGRPIIIAGHSQGTWHTRRLLKEYFNGTALQKQLVCAYLVGYAVYKDDYPEIKVCAQATETGCYVSWSSFKEGYFYPDTTQDILVGEVSVNPISWTTDTASASGDIAVLLKPQKKKRYYTEARIKNDMLWVDTKLLFVRRFNTMHVVDYNLYWDSIRKNVATRVEEFLE
ncbi:MAG: DUF3089 domain-containing protein [Chitinophagales bacterium]